MGSLWALETLTSQEISKEIANPEEGYYSYQVHVFSTPGVLNMIYERQGFFWDLK